MKILVKERIRVVWIFYRYDPVHDESIICPAPIEDTTPSLVISAHEINRHVQVPI